MYQNSILLHFCAGSCNRTKSFQFLSLITLTPVLKSDLNSSLHLQMSLEQWRERWRLTFQHCRRPQLHGLESRLGKCSCPCSLNQWEHMRWRCKKFHLLKFCCITRHNKLKSSILLAWSFVYFWTNFFLMIFDRFENTQKSSW